MKRLALILALLFCGDSALAAWTAPTLPTLPDIRVAASLRTGTCADSAALMNYVNKAVGSPCGLSGGATFGDLVELNCGTTYVVNLALLVPNGTIVGIAPNENWVTFQAKCIGSLPPAGTRVALSDIANMPTIVGPDAATEQTIHAAVDAVHHYRFVGIHFTTPGVFAGGAIGNSTWSIFYMASSNAADPLKRPHHFSFERVIMQPAYDFGPHETMAYQGNHFKLVDSILDGCHSWVFNNEDKCFTAQYGAGPYQIENNQFSSGAGEMIFFGANQEAGVPADTPDHGWHYDGPKDITIRRNYFHAKLSYLRTHATYNPACPETPAAGGTIMSDVGDGMTVTFSNAQAMGIGTLPGQTWIKATSGPAAGQARRLVSITDSTHYRINAPFIPDLSAGTTWRWNGQSYWARKNSGEIKSGQRILIENNIYENGWADAAGQQNTLALKVSETGHTTDVTVRYNKWNNTWNPIAMAIETVMRTSAGPAAEHIQRLWIHDNLFQDSGNTSQDPSNNAPGAHVISLYPNVDRYGSVYNGTGIIASALTGSGVTFTMSGGSDPFDVFFNAKVGQVMKLYSVDRNTLMGQATVTGITSSKILVGTVTSMFTDSALTSPGVSASRFYMGDPAVAGTRYVGDSWRIDHNTSAGTGSQYLAFLELQDKSLDNTVIAPQPYSKATNFIFQNNVLFMSNHVGAGIGKGPVIGVRDSTSTHSGNIVLTDYLDAPTVQKNVLFGPQIILTDAGNGLDFQYNGSPMVAGYGSGFNTAVHTPNQTGSTQGGTVGFTDYAGYNFKLTNAGPYSDTWSSDNDPPGVHWDTLVANLAGVPTGDPEVVTGGGGMIIGPAGLKLGPGGGLRIKP